MYIYLKMFVNFHFEFLQEDAIYAKQLIFFENLKNTRLEVCKGWNFQTWAWPGMEIIWARPDDEM